MDRQISDKTTIPLGWLIPLISMSGGAVVLAVSIAFYVANIESKASVALEKIDEQKVDVNSTLKDVQYNLQIVNQRLSRIEGYLEKRSK